MLSNSAIQAGQHLRRKSRLFPLGHKNLFLNYMFPVVLECANSDLALLRLSATDMLRWLLPAAPGHELCLHLNGSGLQNDESPKRMPRPLHVLSRLLSSKLAAGVR